MRVLIIEDESQLAQNVACVFRETANYAVDISGEGIDGLHLARTNPYDLIVLDLMLPGMAGLEILQRLRAEGKTTPILILTARDTSADIIEGLNGGCDDYLTKPFDMGELMARCKALIRRSYGQVSPKIELGALSVDTQARRVEFERRASVLLRMNLYLFVRASV